MTTEWGDGDWGNTVWSEIEAFTDPVEYGDGSETFPRWGDGVWGIFPLYTYDPDDYTYEEFYHDNIQDAWENVDNEALTISEDDPLHNLLTVLQTESDSFDDELATQYRNLFVQTAQGPFLDRLAERYQLHRRDGEGDERLRRRIKAAIAAATSKATFEYFASIVLFVLDAAPNEVKLLPPSETGNAATIVVATSASVLDDTSFTNSEIVSLLNESVPAGGSVEIRTDGTFEFDGQNFTPDPNTGFGEGTFGGAYQ